MPTDRRTQKAEHDAKRRQSQPWRAWYKTQQWKDRRLRQLTRQPLCERCLSQSKITAATVAHHKEKHEGDKQKFFHGELASSCKPCHDSTEQSIERTGYEKGCDADGKPISADHPWNKKHG